MDHYTYPMSGPNAPWQPSRAFTQPLIAAQTGMPCVLETILIKTQQAVEAATAAASEAERLIADQEQQQSPSSTHQPAEAAKLKQQSYQAAEAAMDSAEQALSVAVRLLQDTQRLVLLQGGAATRSPFPFPFPILQQQQQQQQQMQGPIDPDLQDTCDSHAASSMAYSHSMSSDLSSRG